MENGRGKAASLEKVYFLECQVWMDDLNYLTIGQERSNDGCLKKSPKDVRQRTG